MSADVAYNLLSGKKVKSATLESELLKKLPKDRLQMIVEAKEKAFVAVCEKAKAAEKETFALDGFYLGMSFDDMKVVFSHHFPKLEIKEMAAPRFRYVRGDYGSLRVNIARD